MKTIAPSPLARARAEGRLLPVAASRASSTMVVPVGTLVYDAHDPRHAAEVVATLHSAVVKVRFLDTRWIGYIPFHRVRRADT